MKPQISQITQIEKVADRDPRTYAIIGAAMEVHSELGCGFLEAVYHAALSAELTARGIGHRREVAMPVTYKGLPLDLCYRVDFVCYGEVLVEIKAIEKLGRIEHAQIINYLRISGYKTALILNFGAHSLEYRRFISGEDLRSTVRDEP